MSVNETGSLADPAGNPYVGPRPFDQDDAAAGRYHGREREARDLLALITRERLVLFYSQSGAGKSSLLRASLIPALRELGFDVLPIARVSGAQDAPAANPFLYNLILSLNEGLPPEQRSATETLSADLARLSLARYLGGAPAAAATDPAIDPAIDAAGAELAPAVLLIDQFEEIITSYPNRWQERRAFFEQLRDAMQEIPRLWVVLTLREEYVGPLEPYAELMPNRLRARYYMQRMGVEAALEAVSKPAAVFGRPFAPGVAETLVDNLRSVRVPPLGEPELGQYVEPVQLQVVCHRLWHQVTQASAAAASAAGAVTSAAGAVTSAAGVQPEEATGAPAITAADLPLDYIDQALTWFYRDALASALAGAAVIAAGVDESELRRWFDREAITVGGIRNSVLRDEGGGRTGSLPNAAIDALLRRYLLRAELRAGAAWVELVHDRFVEPIRDDNAAWFPQHMNALQRQAILWRDEGRRPGLLLEGRLLQEAAGWAAAHPAALEPIDKEFLAACERQAANQRRARWFALAALAVGVLLLAGLLALQTYLRRVEAEQQAMAARQQEKLLQAQAERANTEARAKQRAEEAAEEALQRNLSLNMQTERARQAMLAAQAAEQRAVDLADVAQSRQLAAESARLLEAGEIEGALLAAVEAHTFTQTAESGAALGLAATSPLASRHTLLAAGAQGHMVSWNGNGTHVVVAEPQFNANEPPTADEPGEWPQTYTLHLFDAANYQAIVRLPNVLNWQFNNAKTQLLVTTAADGLQLWDATSGALVLQFGAASQGATNAAWDENDSRVLAVSADGSVYVWDAASGVQQLRLASADETIATALWNPNGASVLTWAEDGSVRLWDAATGSSSRRLGGPGVSTRTPLWSADGAQVLTVNEGGFTIWDARTGRRLQDLHGEDTPFYQLQWSASGKHVLARYQDNTLYVWNVSESEPVLRVPDLWTFGGFEQQPQLFTLTANNIVTVWDIDTGARLYSVNGVAGAALNADGERLLVNGTNGGIRVIEFASGERLLTLDTARFNVYFAQWLDVTGDIATQEWDDSSQIWDGETGALLANSTGGTIDSGGRSFEALIQSPDGSKLAGIDAVGAVRVWDTMAAPHLAKAHGAEGAAWYGEDTQVLTLSRNGTVSVWDAAGDLLLQIETDNQNLDWAGMTTDERHILTMSGDFSELQIWDAATGALSWQVNDMLARCWSRDNTRIAIIGADGFLRIRDVAQGQEILALPAAGMTGCVWDGSGGKLAAWDAKWVSNRHSELPIRIWDTATGAEIAAIELDAGHVSPSFNHGMTRALLDISSMSLDPDQFVLWDVESNSELAHAEGYGQWNEDKSQALVNLAVGGALLWDAADGRTLYTWPEAQSTRWVMDSTAVAGSAAAGIITLWDGTNAEQLLALPGHVLHAEDYYNFTMNWSDDYRRIVTSDALGTLRIWDAADGTLLDQFAAPLGIDSRVYLDAEGGRILIRDESGAVLRDVAARRDLLRLDNVRGAWVDGAWSRLLVINRDGGVQLILTDPDALAAAACARAPRNLTWVEWQRLLPGDPYRPTCPGALIPPDVVEGVRREAAALLAAGNEAAARRRVDELNGWLAQSRQAEQFGLDFAALAEP